MQTYDQLDQLTGSVGTLGGKAGSCVLTERNAQQVRLECLKLALNYCSRDVDKMIEEARKMADFVLGTRDAEILRAAREMAEKVNPYSD